MSQTLQLGCAQVEEAKLADLCRRYGVREPSLFGSAVRNEMRPESDIDLLVEFLPAAHVDLVDYAGLMLDLARLLGRKVDLVSKNGLKPLIRSAVLEEARLGICGMRVCLSTTSLSRRSHCRVHSRSRFPGFSRVRDAAQRSRPETGRHRRSRRTCLGGPDKPPSRGSLASDRGLPQHPHPCVLRHRLGCGVASCHESVSSLARADR
jgi:uncharacterized protein